jgi:hypothetical protein
LKKLGRPRAKVAGPSVVGSPSSSSEENLTMEVYPGVTGEPTALKQALDHRSGSIDEVAADGEFSSVYDLFYALFEPDDLIEFRAFQRKDLGKGVHREWVKAGDRAALAALLQRMKTRNDECWDVFFSVNPRSGSRGKTEDVAVCRAVCADFENISLDEALQRIEDAGLPSPSIILFSGGGVHVYWLLTVPLEGERGLWPTAINRIALLLGSDTSIADLPRVMRAPDFRNNKEKYPSRPRSTLYLADRSRRYDFAIFLPDDAVPGDNKSGIKRPRLNHLGEPTAGNDVLNMSIPGGGRHDALHRFAVLQVFRTVGFDKPNVIAEMQEIVWSLSQTHCSPPKEPRERADSDRSVECAVKYRLEIEARQGAVADLATEEEVSEVVESFENWANSDAADKPAVQGLELHGLKRLWHTSNKHKYEEWLPGTWRLETVESDPPEIRLIVPAWQKTPCGGTVVFSMTDFLSPARVAERVFESTHRVMLAAYPKKWAQIWNGWERRDEQTRKVVVEVTGLRAKLIENATSVAVGESSKRYAELAAAMLAHLSHATELEDEPSPVPDEGGRPTWVTPDALWFRWSRMWEDIQRSQKVEGREKTDLKRRLCKAVDAADFVHDRFTFAGRRLSYVVFDRSWLDALQGLADGSDGVTET